MDKKALMYYVGKSCQRWRATMDYTIAQIVNETGYSAGSISNFEHGTNNNAFILMWYIARGFDVEKDFINPLQPNTKTNANNLFDIMGRM